jgi:regulatory protein
VNFFSGKITQIEKQKKNPSRYSIFLDGKYAFGLDAEILAKYSLITGQIITAKEASDLCNEDERRRGKISALRILARRDHSEKELRNKLSQKGFSENAVQWILSGLREQRFLDDQIFAENFAKNRLIEHPSGKRHLAYELKKKGISESLIAVTIEKIYTEFDEMDLARQLAFKKAKSVENQPYLKKKKKIGDFLISRGFEWEIVNDVVNDVVNEEKENYI